MQHSLHVAVKTKNTIETVIELKIQSVNLATSPMPMACEIY